MTSFGKNVQKPLFLTLTPPAVSLFLLYWLPTSCTILEKRSLRYLKMDLGPRTDRLTDKGNYYGPHRVNMGSKIECSIIIILTISSIDAVSYFSMILSWNISLYNDCIFEIFNTHLGLVMGKGFMRGLHPFLTLFFKIQYPKRGAHPHEPWGILV